MTITDAERLLCFQMVESSLFALDGSRGAISELERSGAILSNSKLKVIRGDNEHAHRNNPFATRPRPDFLKANPFDR